MSESHFISLLSKLINSAELHFHCIHFQSGSGELQLRKKKNRWRPYGNGIWLCDNWWTFAGSSYSVSKSHLWVTEGLHLLFLIMSKVIHILYVDRKRWECYFHLEILRMIVICWCKFTASKKLFNISSCLNVKYVNGKYVDAFYNI